jgi:hypothetical protein
MCKLFEAGSEVLGEIGDSIGPGWHDIFQGLFGLGAIVAGGSRGKKMAEGEARPGLRDLISDETGSIGPRKPTTGTGDEPLPEPEPEPDGDELDDQWEGIDRMQRRTRKNLKGRNPKETEAKEEERAQKARELKDIDDAIRAEEVRAVPDEDLLDRLRCQREAKTREVRAIDNTKKSEDNSDPARRY